MVPHGNLVQGKVSGTNQGYGSILSNNRKLYLKHLKILLGRNVENCGLPSQMENEKKMCNIFVKNIGTKSFGNRLF